MVDSLDALEANIRQVREALDAAAQRAGRQPDEIRLIAVTKTVPAELVAAAFRLGLRHFGENRVQEAVAKIAGVGDLLDAEGGPQWHLIGHLQTNKARQAVALFDEIQSVDSVRLARRLSDEAARLDRTLPILLEVNVAREATKSGFLPEEMPEAAKAVVQLPNLKVGGLMTVAPLAVDPSEVRPVFRELRRWSSRLQELAPEADWSQLSMGMSDDYAVAIEEGASIVRLGRAIFGARPPRLP